MSTASARVGARRTRGSAVQGSSATRGLFSRMRRAWQLYLLLIPALVWLAVFKYWPMYGVQIAFRDYNPADGFSGSPFVGWKHFIRFFNSPQFERILTNTVLLAVENLVIVFPIPIILALLVYNVRNGKLREFVRTVLYTPTFISTVVVVGMIFIMVSPRGGLANQLVTAFGGDPILFMGDPEWFRPLFIISTVWQEAGFQMVIYLAALSAIDPALHDAAKVDGANGFKRIWHIDLPGIAPTIIVMLMLAIGNLLNVSFEKALLMQTPLNISSSQVIQTYVYQQGLQNAQFSYSAAIGLFNSVVNLALLIVFNVLVRRGRGKWMGA